MSKDQRVYEVTVEGTYYAAGKTIKKYAVKFKLPSLDSALSVILKHLLDNKLRESYEDYMDYRTHDITETRILGESPDEAVLSIPIGRMSFGQLADFCALRSLFVDPYKFSVVDQARGAVQQAWSDKQQQMLDEKERQEKDKEGVDLRKLNDLKEQEVATVAPGLKIGIETGPTKDADSGAQSAEGAASKIGDL